MPQKPKTGASASKAKKPKETQKEQSARFIETAMTIGVDESGGEFEKALIKILPEKSGTQRRSHRK